MPTGKDHLCLQHERPQRHRRHAGGCRGHDSAYPVRSDATIKDGKGQTTAYLYDRDGNLVRQDAADHDAQAYDRADRLIETVDRAASRSTTLTTPPTAC